MFGKSNVLLVTFLLAAFLLAGCGQGSQGGSTTGDEAGGGGTTASAAFPVTVEDSLGREVRIEEEPEQIGSMAPSVTETVFAVGAGDRVAGVSTADDYPQEVEGIEKIGDYQQVNAEKVASLGIDLLFLSFDSTTEEQARDLEEKTRAEVIVINPTSVEEAIESVGTVGEAVGEPEKAQVVEERLRSELGQLRSQVEGLPEPTLFYELSYDPLFTVGPGSFINDVIEIAGGRNVAADAGQAYPQYPVERLIQEDPELYLAGASSGATVEEIVNRPPYSSLNAVRQGSVFVIDDDLVNRPGPRIVDGVREMAETLHPDAFGEPGGGAGGETTGGGG